MEITRIPGLGPKRVRPLHEQLGIASLDDLRAAVEEGRLADVPGFGAKAEENVLAALAADAAGERRARLLLSQALAWARPWSRACAPHAMRVELAGSARRMADPCKDLDVVAATADPAALVEAFERLPRSTWCTRPGAAGARAVTHSGVPVDLRVVPEEAFGNLLQHFTGSGKHNEALAHRGGEARAARERVRDRRRRERRRPTPSPPRRRSTRSWACSSSRRSCARTAASCEAARAGELPELIELERHPRRPAHAHRGLGRPQHDRGDGRAAKERGYEYVGDHRPLGEPRLRRRRAARRAAAPDRAGQVGES